MKKIYIGFSAPKKISILSLIIKLIQRTQYSHVYCRFYSEEYERNIIYQASGLQVNFIGEELFKDHCIVIKEFEFEVTDDIYKKMLTFSWDKAGYPYSIKQLFNILIYMLTGVSSIFRDDRSKYVCAELIAELLQISMPIEKDLDLITPKDIYKILENNNG